MHGAWHQRLRIAAPVGLGLYSIGVLVYYFHGFTNYLWVFWLCGCGGLLALLALAGGLKAQDGAGSRQPQAHPA